MRFVLEYVVLCSLELEKNEGKRLFNCTELELDKYKGTQNSVLLPSVTTVIRMMVYHSV